MLTFPCILFAPLKHVFIKPQTQNTFCIHVDNDVWNATSILKNQKNIFKRDLNFYNPNIQVQKYVVLRCMKAQNINNNTLVGLFNLENVQYQHQK